MVNEIVICTISGYAPWPARILDITGQTIAIEFFGTGQINLVRANAICPFNSNKIIPFLNRKGYKKAIIELEMVLGVPLESSLVRN